MHPAAIAALAPDRAAIIMGSTGAITTFRQLDERSNQLARVIRAAGVQRGGSLAIFAENHPRFLEVTWAAQRSGIYYTAINSHLTAAEAGYIIDDCDASIVVSTEALADVAVAACSITTAPQVKVRLLLGGSHAGWENYEATVDPMPTTPLADESEGDFMLYSSGTTGRPKGIRRQLVESPMGQPVRTGVPLLQALELQAGDIYLTPAPLCHAAPMAWSMSAQRLGATVVVMETFDAERCLALIDRNRVTHAQFVPTMFVRMLKLPPEVRARYDISSLQSVVHAAAPCPVDVKRSMIDWWGPIINEYYSSTEGAGITWITSTEWLERPGSVGRAISGTPFILDDDRNEVATGQIGTVWFSGGQDFHYHKDPEKTSDAHDDTGLATVGDVGYLDHEGFLFLTDRKAFMIISGGVNIYPQEAENVLINHPKVFDVGVIGVPHAEMGESVKVVVQPVSWTDVGPDLEAELLAYCREHLAAFKCPRSIDFDAALPRLDTGKLYKKALRARYWP